jgi:hypothetical protein
VCIPQSVLSPNLGDDISDEDAFVAVNGFGPGRGVSVRVMFDNDSKAESERKQTSSTVEGGAATASDGVSIENRSSTNARYTLRDPTEVRCRSLWTYLIPFCLCKSLLLCVLLGVVVLRVFGQDCVYP